MKKILVAMIAGTLLISGMALAQDQATPPTAPPAAAVPTEADCKLDDINKALDETMAAIKASPAYGHAGGHFAKAEKALQATKKQLDVGCKAWVKAGEKAAAKKK